MKYVKNTSINASGSRQAIEILQEWGNQYNHIDHDDIDGLMTYRACGFACAEQFFRAMLRQNK